MVKLFFMMWVSLSHAITVLVVDSGVDTKDPLISKWMRANIGEPSHDHGQNIVSGILLGGYRLKSKSAMIEEWEPVSPVCDQVRVDSCNYILMGIDYCAALYPKYDFVNISASGVDSSGFEFRKIKEALAKGTLITVSAGNDGVSVTEGIKVMVPDGTKGMKSIMKPIYPAMYKYLDFMPGYFVVTNTSATSNRAPGSVTYDYEAYLLSSNRRERIKKVKGTSVSSALYLNNLIRQRCSNAK